MIYKFTTDLSKIFEKLVSDKRLLYNFFIPKHQSGFSSGYSTSTSLLSLTDNIITYLVNLQRNYSVVVSANKTVDMFKMTEFFHIGSYADDTQTLFHFQPSSTDYIYLNVNRVLL